MTGQSAKGGVFDLGCVMRTAGLALALLTSATATADAQVRTPPDSAAILLAHCVALKVPPVAQALDSARGPLLMVGEVRLGPVRPVDGCPVDAADFEVLPEVRFIRPSAARDMFGEEGRNGAVTMDVAPRAARLPEQPRLRARPPGSLELRLSASS